MTCGKILSKHDQSHVLLMRFGSSLALSSLRIIIYITGLKIRRYLASMHKQASTCVF